MAANRALGTPRPGDIVFSEEYRFVGMLKQILHKGDEAIMEAFNHEAEEEILRCKYSELRIAFEDEIINPEFWIWSKESIGKE